MSKTFYIILISILFFLFLWNILSFKYFYIFDDAGFHIGVINGLREGEIPPFNPCAQQFILHYPWFYHLIVAEFANLFLLDTVIAVKVFSTLLFSLTFILLFLLGNHYLNNKKKALIFSTFIMLFFLNYFIIAPQSFGILFISFYMFMIVKFFQKKRLKYLFMAGLISSISFYFHGITALFLILCNITLFIYFLKKFITSKNLRDFTIQTFSLFTPYIFALPYYIIFLAQSQRPVLMFFPFLGFGLLLFHNIKNLSTYLIFLLIPKLFAKVKNEQLFFKYLIFSILIFIGVFSFSHSFDIYRYFLFLFIPVLLIFLSKKSKKNVILIVFLGLLIPHLIFIYDSLPFPTDYDKRIYNVCDFIKNNTPESSIVASMPSTKYLALCERKNILCFPYGQTSMMFNITQEYRDLISLYYQPSKKVIKSYNVSFLVLCENENRFFSKYIGINISNFSVFPKIYQKEKCEIIDLKDNTLISNLPENYNETFIHEILLNKIHYRIWFESPQKSIIRKIETIIKKFI